MVRGCRQSPVGDLLERWLPTLEQLQRAQSRHIKKQSAPRKTRRCGEACVLIALISGHSGDTGCPNLLMAYHPNSLAPVRNDLKNRPFQKARRFATRWVRSPAPSQPQER